MCSLNTQSLGPPLLIVSNVSESSSSSCHTRSIVQDRITRKVSKLSFQIQVAPLSYFQITQCIRERVTLCLSRDFFPLIKAYAIPSFAVVIEQLNSHQPALALETLQEIWTWEIRATHETYLNILHHFIEQNSSEGAWAILVKIRQQRISLNSKIYEPLLNLFLTKKHARGCWMIVRIITDSLNLKTQIYHNVLNLLIEQGEIKEAWEIFQEMKKQRKCLNMQTAKDLLYSLIGAKYKREALIILFEEIIPAGTKLDAAMYYLLLKLLVNEELSVEQEDEKRIWDILAWMIKEKINLDAETSAAISNYFEKRHPAKFKSISSWIDRLSKLRSTPEITLANS